MDVDEHRGKEVKANLLPLFDLAAEEDTMWGYYFSHQPAKRQRDDMECDQACKPAKRLKCETEM